MDLLLDGKHPAVKRLVMEEMVAHQLGMLAKRAGQKALSAPVLSGEALTGIRVPSDQLAASCCDESNAFTAVMAPWWMHGWHAGPPVLAFMVWRLLTAAVKAKAGPWGWVYPLYMRLPMG